MKIADVYNKMPYDTSGSMVKNRFGYELIFGMSKIFDEYEKHDDLKVVFDYVCDIEVHFSEQLEFYQVKTTNDCKPFNIGFLTNRKKSNVGLRPSILGKLFSIINEEELNEDNIRLNVVGNVPFKDDKNMVKINVQKFEEMSTKTKETIITAIKDELNIKIKNLNNLYYVYFTLDLDNYEDTMLGKTLNFYNKITGAEAKKPKVLYSTLKDMIYQKATCEKRCSCYEEVIENKAITKSDVKKLIDYHKQSNNLIEKCTIEIRKKFFNIADRTKMLNSLREIVDEDNLFYKKEKYVIRKIVNDDFPNYNGTEEDFINNVIDNCMKNYPIEYSYHDKYVFILYEILKYEEELLYE